MPNMKKHEIDEVNCQESFVTLSIRGDMIGTVAKCLMNCSDHRSHCSAARWLGEKLARIGDMIYGETPVYTKIGDVVVDHAGVVYDNFENRGDENEEQEQIKTVA